MPKRIILGSSSAGRKQVLQNLGLDFETVPADIDEKAIRHESPAELVAMLAKAKAAALWPEVAQDAWLITADSVVLTKGELREKPRTEAEARQFLANYPAHPAEIVTASLVSDPATGSQWLSVDKTTVYFSDFPETLVSLLVADGRAYAGAGGFRIQDPEVRALIKQVEGEWEAAIGLSAAHIKKVLALPNQN